MSGHRVVTDGSLRDRAGVFRDRSHAGELLARLVDPERRHDPLVLAVPAGGVPVALELARRLRLGLDVAVVSKLTLPWNSEAGFGALAFDGSHRLNEDLVRDVGLDEASIEVSLARTRARVERRVERLRGGSDPLDLTALAVLVVDDGLASGFTLLVAVEAIRRAGAERVVVAVPTASLGSAERVAREVDALYVANMRSGSSFAVADAYERWNDVSEDEAARLLRAAARG